VFFPIALSINIAQSALALFVSGVLADNPHNTIATNDLAVPADFLY